VGHNRVAMENARGDAKRGRGRAFRGLVLVFLLSFINLTGVLLTIAALGGLGLWTRWQFIGAFGLIEAASGLANVISPNVWRLPIAELKTSESSDAKLAGSALLLPHWGALARCAAGAVCLGIAAWHEDVDLVTAGLVPLILLLAWVILAISAALARAGVARPDLDVVQFSVRWNRRERELAPLSIGSAVLQFLLSIAPIPAVKLLPPSVLYQPALGPSLEAMIIALALASGLGLLVYFIWSGRIEFAAPPEQQREAEEHA
jgi:hypothetical protein